MSSLKIFWKSSLFFFFFFSSPCPAEFLDRILRSETIETLTLNIKKQEQDMFLNKLCEKQKASKKAPIACYELDLSGDNWCLSLKIEDFSLESLNKALKSSFLSSTCRKYLKEKQKILIYREKDLLLLK